MKEPTRLCESDDFPPALRGAFRALEQDAPSAETVLRVQRALQALPAASGGAAVASTIGTSKLWLVTTLIAGAATLGVVTHGRFGAPRATQDTRERIQAARDGVEMTPLPVDPPELSRAVPDVVHAPAVTKAPDEAERADPPAQQLAVEQEPRQLSTPAAAKGGELAAPPRARARIEARAKSARVDASVQRNTVAAARSARAGSAHSLVADASPSQAAAPEPAEEPAAEASAAPRTNTDEAALLAQAKRLSSSDASAALREVEALAQRYPAGTFVQERELLAIQLHQRLGHATVVEKLKRHFLERFPNSVYRRALPP